MTNRPILLMGVTDYAAVFLDTFEAVSGAEFVGFVQNLGPSHPVAPILGRPIFWTGDIGTFRDTHDLICVLATTRRRAWIEELEVVGFRFASLVHPSCSVSRRSELGFGVSVEAGGVIVGFSAIGDHCRIGRRVSIGHQTVIGRCSTIHPGAVVSGNCTIGQQVIIGTGAVVIDGVQIGDGAFIAAGALVTKDVPAGALFAGHPGRVVKPDYGPR